MPNAFGMQGRELRRQVPAKRVPDNVGACDPEVVEQPDDVEGHFAAVAAASCGLRLRPWPRRST